MKQVILITEKRNDNTIARNFIEVEQTQDTHTRIPWNGQSINQESLEMLAKEIAQEWGVEYKQVELIPIIEKISQRESIPFTRLQEE